MFHKVRIIARDGSEGSVVASLQDSTHPCFWTSLPMFLSGFNKLFSSIFGRKGIYFILLHWALLTYLPLWAGYLTFGDLTACCWPHTHPPPCPKRTPSQGYSVFLPPSHSFIHSCSFLQNHRAMFTCFSSYPLHVTLPSPIFPPQGIIKGDF